MEDLLPLFVMGNLILKDPTCFSVLNAVGLPNAFLDSFIAGVLFFLLKQLLVFHIVWTL